MITRRCDRCRATLVGGLCPGLKPLIRVRDVDHGTAHQLVHLLGDDITIDMVRNWHRRGDLPGVKVGRTVYHSFPQAATVERDKRLETRGRPRRVCAPAPVAA